MSERDIASFLSEALDFDSPQPTDDQEPPELTCTLCQEPIADTYFSTADAIYCSSCGRKAEEESQKPGAAGTGRLARAFSHGLGAAAIGTLVYFLVLWLTGYEIGLLAIAVGWFVGKAVYQGSGETARAIADQGVAVDVFTRRQSDRDAHTDSIRQSACRSPRRWSIYGPESDLVTMG